MPIAVLKAAVEKFHNVANSYYANYDYNDSYDKTQASKASKELLDKFNAASSDEISELLLDDPNVLRRLAYQPEVELALINKASAPALNQAIEFLTREMRPSYTHQAAILSLLSNKRSGRAVLEALLAKADLDLLLEQQRKIPYSNFLLNTDSFYNDEHERIILQLRRIIHDENTDPDVKKKALYCLGSITLTLSTRFPERPYLYHLAYDNLGHLDNLIPLLKAHKAENVLAAIVDIKKDKEDPNGAAYLIMTAQYLDRFDKRKNKKALTSTLEKLNRYEVPNSKLGLNSAYFHLRMAEVLGNKSNLALFSEKKSTAMLKNALNHAEMARDTASIVLLQRDRGVVREGFDYAPFEASRDAAEKIIIGLRSGHQGKFSSEEKQTSDVITALENKILSTNWKIRKPFVKYPDHVKLILEQISAFKKGAKSDAAALRTIEDIARKAAAHKKFSRDPETMKFYQAMSTSKSRNTYLNLGQTQQRNLLFNQRAQAEVENEPGMRRRPSRP